MLELATRFSTAQQAPKRTLVFVAFDCEERDLWGAVAFVMRKDVDPRAIVLNVNIDMLGRKGFDVMENTLFMAESHVLPSVHDDLAQVVSTTVLPIPSLAVSGRGDHAIFEKLNIPILMFTCGLYGDYHRKEDTLEKLDLELLSASVNAIEKSIASTVQVSSLEASPLPLTGSDATLASGNAMLSAMLDHPENFNLTPNTIKICRKLHADTHAHLQKAKCNQATHNMLIMRGVFALTPIMESYEQSIFEDDREESN